MIRRQMSWEQDHDIEKLKYCDGLFWDVSLWPKSGWWCFHHSGTLNTILDILYKNQSAYSRYWSTTSQLCYHLEFPILWRSFVTWNMTDYFLGWQRINQISSVWTTHCNANFGYFHGNFYIKIYPLAYSLESIHINCYSKKSHRTTVLSHTPKTSIWHFAWVEHGAAANKTLHLALLTSFPPKCLNFWSKICSRIFSIIRFWPLFSFDMILSR